MRPSAIPVVLGLGLALGAALPARADGVHALRLGDSTSGTVDAGEFEAIPFDAVKGTLLDLDLKMAAGSGPAVVVLQPDRTPLAGLAAFSKVDRKNAGLKVRKAPLEQTGRHFVLVQPAVPGPYSLRIKGKPLSKTVFDGFISPYPPSEVEFGAVPGALLTIVAKASRGSSVSPKVVFLEGPDGALVDLGGAAVHTATATSEIYKGLPLPALGKYTVAVGTTTGQFGDYGTVQIIVKFPAVKKALVPEVDVVVDPFLDSVVPDSGFDNLAYAAVRLAGDFFRAGATVKLEGPATLTGTSVTLIDDGTLDFDVDLVGAPAGAYDVVLSYPNGAGVRLVGGFTVLNAPVPSGISPTTAFDNRTQSFTVTGSRFLQGLSVSVVPSAGGSAVAGTVTASGATQASVDLPLLNAPLGDFDLVVTNPDGGTEVLPGALTVIRGPRLLAASPLLGHDNDDALEISLGGLYFQGGLACALEKSGQTPIPGAVADLVVTPGPCSATATFDLVGKASGAWTLRVTNPDGGTSSVVTPFTLSRAPRPGAVTGGRVFDGFPATGLSIAGTDFVSGAQVSFEKDGVATHAATNESVDGPGTSITFDVSPAGVPAGEHDVRVVNPDGGSDLSPAAVRVLGRRTLVSDGAAAGRPSLAYNAEDDEFLATWSVFDGTQWDVRARRYSAATGEPLGSEILVTTASLDPGTTVDQTQPAAVYAPSLDRWMVVYAWNDPANEGNKCRAYAQILERDGTLQSDQTNAFPVYLATEGTITSPRVAWNPVREEWLVVLGAGTSSSNINYSCIKVNSIFEDGSLFLGAVSSGTLIATTHTVATGGDPLTVDDRDFDPDVAWSPSGGSGAAGGYCVTWTLDVVEAGLSPPPDSGSDVRARFFDGSLASGPVTIANLTTLGNVADKNEGHSRVATSGATYFVAWDYESGAGNRDVRGWLVNASTRAKVGSLVAVEETVSVDAAFPALDWDATSAATGYLVSYALVPDGSGTSSSVVTRLAQSGTSAVVSATHQTVAAALSNAAFGAGGVAARGIAGEFTAAWTVTGSALSPADAEIRFTK
jgi:hypothetical protein